MRELRILLLSMLLLVGCHAATARSERSFDEINRLVQGKTADQVVRLLGEPDTRQTVFDSDEKWIWWNYTFIDGKDYPPELRGRMVHLEIVFTNPARPYEPPRPYTEWSIDGSFGVNYTMPSHDV